MRIQDLRPRGWPWGAGSGILLCERLLAGTLLAGTLLAGTLLAGTLLCGTLLCGSAQAASDDLAVPERTGMWSSTMVPMATHQRHLAQAIEGAVQQLELKGLEGKTMSLEVTGLLQDSEWEVWSYVRQSIEARVALLGGRIAPGGPDGRILVRVPQLGYDRVLGEKEVRVRQNRGTSAKAVMWAGAASVLGGFALGTRLYCDSNGMGLGSYTCVSGFDRSRRPALMVGIGLGVGIAGIMAKDRPLSQTTRIIPTEGLVARAVLDLTVVPADGTAWSTHGSRDIPVVEPTRSLR